MRKLLLFLALLLPLPALAVPTFTFKTSGVNNAVSSTVTSGSFSTSSASLIIIAVSWQDNPADHTITSISVGGNTPVFRVRKTDATDPGSTFGTAIYTYWSSSALTGVTASATMSGASPFEAIQVIEATGTDASSGGGATNTNFATSGTSASVGVTTTVSDSKIIASCSTFNVTWTAGTNTVELTEVVDSNGDGFFVMANTQTTTSGNTYTATETNGTSGQWYCAGLEVLVAAPVGPPWTINATTQGATPLRIRQSGR